MNDHNSYAERRLTVRLLAYWERLRGDRPMPKESDIDPDDIGDLWEFCFLLHIKDLSQPDYNFTYLGDAIANAYHGDLDPDEHDGLYAFNAKALSVGYAQVIASKKPLLDEGEFKNTMGQVVKYRQCLLPLGEGDQVDAIFGGMRFKVF